MTPTENPVAAGAAAAVTPLSTVLAHHYRIERELGDRIQNLERIGAIRSIPD